MILQSYLPIMPWMEERTRRLPGVVPVSTADWLYRDDAFGAQMAYRETLIKTRRESVYCISSEAEAATQELLGLIVEECGYPRRGKIVTRPDGVEVDISADEPLVTAGRLVQEDLCILQPNDDVHRLTAGLMCFPASWTPVQKFGKTLVDIHGPVAEYAVVGDVVQRMFHALRPEQPLMRANFLIYTDPELHQPRLEGETKPIESGCPRFIRVERQSFRKLPVTGAVTFAIHTYVVPASTLPVPAFEALAALNPELIS